MRQHWLVYFVVAIFAAADVATLILLSRWVGIPFTLVVVVVSTFLGLVECRRLMRKLSTRWERDHAESPTTPQTKLYFGAEVGLTAISMLLFVFPGLLSDALACLMLFPVVQGRVRELVRWIQRTNAARDAKAGADSAS